LETKCIVLKADLSVVLDPGVVFGTGVHATTRDCLRAMAHLYEKTAFDTALDLGTGTGILAIASAAAHDSP
jgi:ribosomal protein L11 methyltransferase